MPPTNPARRAGLRRRALLFRLFFAGREQVERRAREANLVSADEVVGSVDLRGPRRSADRPAASLPDRHWGRTGTGDCRTGPFWNRPFVFRPGASSFCGTSTDTPLLDGPGAHSANPASNRRIGYDYGYFDVAETARNSTERKSL